MQNKKPSHIITAYDLEKTAKPGLFNTNFKRWIGEKMFSGFREKMERLRSANDIISEWENKLKPALKAAKKANSHGRFLDMLASLSTIEQTARSIAGAKSVIEGHTEVSAPDFDRPDLEGLQKMDIPDKYFGLPTDQIETDSDEYKKFKIRANTINDGFISRAGFWQSIGAGEYIQSLFDKQLRDRRVAAKQLLGEAEVLVNQLTRILDRMDDYLIAGDINAYHGQLNIIANKSKAFTDSCNSKYDANFKSEVERIKARIGQESKNTSPINTPAAVTTSDPSAPAAAAAAAQSSEVSFADLPGIAEKIKNIGNPQDQISAKTDVVTDTGAGVKGPSGQENPLKGSVQTPGPLSEEQKSQWLSKVKNADDKDIIEQLLSDISSGGTWHGIDSDDDPEAFTIEQLREIVETLRGAESSKDVSNQTSVDTSRKDLFSGPGTHSYVTPGMIAERERVAAQRKNTATGKALDSLVDRAEAEEKGDVAGVAKAEARYADAVGEFKEAKQEKQAIKADEDKGVVADPAVTSLFLAKLKEIRVNIKTETDAAKRRIDSEKEKNRDAYIKHRLVVPMELFNAFKNRDVYLEYVKIYEKYINMVKTSTTIDEAVKDGVIKGLNVDVAELIHRIEVNRKLIADNRYKDVIENMLRIQGNLSSPEAPSAKLLQPIDDTCPSPNCGKHLIEIPGGKSRDPWIKCESFVNSKNQGCGFKLNPDKGDNPGRKYLTFRNKINPQIQTNLPCSQCGTPLKIKFGRMTGYFFSCDTDYQHKNNDKDKLKQYVELARSGPPIGESSVKPEVSGEPAKEEEVSQSTGQPVEEGGVIPFKVCGTCNGVLKKTRTLKRIRDKDGGLKIVPSDQFGGKCEKCNKFVLPAKDLEELERLEAEKHKVKQEPILPLVTSSPEALEFDAEALKQISLIEDFYKYLLTNKPDDEDKKNWIDFVNGDIIKSENKNNFQKSLNLLNIIWYIEKKLGIKSVFTHFRGKKSNPAFRDAQGLGLHDVDTSIDPRVGEMLDEELGHEMADKEEELPFVPDLKSKPEPEPLAIEPEVIERRPLREPTQVSTPVNPGEPPTLTNRPLQGLVDKKPAAAVKSEVGKKQETTKPAAQKATTEKKPGEPPTLTNRPLQGLVDSLIAKPKETTTTLNEEQAKPAAKGKKSKKGARANEDFYNELTKVASTNDPYLMATMLIRYSAQIEDTDLDTSLKLLAIAEGILDDE